MFNLKRIKKVGVGIIVFDDICHLKNITSEIRDLCDNITVCLQKTSYHGIPIQDDIVDYVEHLKDENFIDNIIWFEPINLYKEMGQAAPRFVETDKRNFILEYLENDCSHTMVIDSDEFYDHDDFETALKIIDEHDDIKVTYCEYVNYYRDYSHLMVWPFRCYVPFLTESSYRFSFKNGSFDKPSDPTRRYQINEEGSKYCILTFKIIKMHHLSWIRTDIESKIDNWSSRLYFDNFDVLKKQIINSYNNFKDGKNATIMFNTPFNQVVVNKLKNQYINPKYNLLDL